MATKKTTEETAPPSGQAHVTAAVVYDPSPCGSTAMFVRFLF